MPLIKVTTSREPGPVAATELLLTLSKVLAAAFAKPERWVMTCLDPPAKMTFGGSDAPSAYIEVKNIGRMTGSQTKSLSTEITREVAGRLGIPPDRVYIEFADASDYLWGWNGDTFE